MAAAAAARALGASLLAAAASGAAPLYDEGVALSAMRLTQAAYCPEAVNWTCATCDEGARVWRVVEDSASDTKGRAVVGVDRRDETVFVSYRGTENINNWIHDADFVKTCPFEDLPTLCVEKGFHRWHLSLLEAGVAEAVAEAANATGYRALKTMGHSAGGAVAALLAFDVRRGNVLRDVGVGLHSIYTFGSPRVGNPEFADAWKLALGDVPSFRLTHYRDIVPQLPPESLHYRHIPTEVYYDENFTKVTVCDGSGEDSNCSDSCYLTLICDDVHDHMTYLNISVGIAGCEDRTLAPTSSDRESTRLPVN